MQALAKIEALDELDSVIKEIVHKTSMQEIANRVAVYTCRDSTKYQRVGVHTITLAVLPIGRAKEEIHRRRRTFEGAS
jgi:hypothetical protein